MKPTSKDIGFVVIQLILFTAILFDFRLFSLNLGKTVRTVAVIVFLLGGLMTALSLLNLSRNLSPFPSPKQNSNLVSTGLYKYIRHPIYTGIIIAGLGFSVYTSSAYRLAVTLLLLILFYFKSKYEEKKLMEVFSDYAGYMKQTGRFLPKL